MLDLNAKVEGLIKGHDLVFDGVFEAFTPWWGGDESGRVFSQGEGGGLVPHYPEPKAIIGRTKWAIRTVLGYVPRELGEASQGTERSGTASAVKLFVEVVGGGKPYFTEAELPRVSSNKKRYLDELEAMREVGYETLFEDYRSRDRLAEAFRGRRTDFYRLLAIPRFYLRAIGRKNENPVDILKRAVYFQPVRPGFRIRVRVLSRDKRAGRLFTTAMLVTLKYLGIGGAANRGFGRFDLVNADYVDGGVNTKFDITRDSLYDEFRQVGYEPKVDPEGRDPEFPRFPLPEEVREVRGPVSAFINNRKYKAKDIEGVLAAIGLATLKSTWKSYCHNLKGSGRGYHTWVLGLPRKVGNTGYFIPQRKGMTKSPEGSEDEEGRRQSYIVLSPTRGLGVVLLPFYADDYPGIEHRDHGRIDVARVKRATPDCRWESESRSVRDHINVALDWLYELLS